MSAGCVELGANVDAGGASARLVFTFVYICISLSRVKP
jgi:hypothetical protein